MHVDIASLRLFIAVAEELSLTNAAKREHMVLSAASRRVMELEESMGTSLLVRHARGVTLTPAGQSLLHYSRQVVELLHRMHSELGEYAQGVKGHVRLHANASSIMAFLPDAINVFLAKHPLIKLDLEEQIGPAIVRAVAEGTADIGIVAEPTATGDLETLPYRTDHLVAVVPRSHSLAKRKFVKFKDLLDFDFVAPHPESSLHMLLIRESMELGRAIKLRIRARSFDCICRMISGDMGISVLPKESINPEAGAIGIRLIPVDENWATRRLYLCARKFESLNPSARQLVEHLTRT